MYTGEFVQFPGEENLFIIIGVTKGRDGNWLAVLEDINAKTIKLIEKSQLPDLTAKSSIAKGRLSTV